ncbi:MAG: MotA/TolQ/ExbB proton channel family protein [Elainellaceae cyanobacterium]
MNIGELFSKGGFVMWPLLLLSILSLTVVIERVLFWWKILTREREIAGQVLEAAQRDWRTAGDLARNATEQPIGRFLNAGLELKNQEPDVVRLAMEASAQEELAAMHKGDKILEAVIAIAPLLGLLGTVTGLINSLGSIRLGDLGTTATENVTLGISEALITTATGLIIAILSLAFYRVFQGLIAQQAKIFQKAGNELELLYRKAWSGQDNSRPTRTHSSAIAPEASGTSTEAVEPS